MRVKILLFNLCFCLTAIASGQTGNDLSGKFLLMDSLQTPAGITVGPAQYARYTHALISGVTIDLGDTIRSGFYLFPLGGKDPSAVELMVPPSGAGSSYLQGSLSADGSTLVFTLNHYDGWTGNDLAMSTRLADGTYSAPVLLSDLNKADTSDCYPWISDDGKRLYYLQDERLMMADRQEANETFTGGRPVQYTGTVDLRILSVWLDSKEKHIWMISDNRIYTAHRKNKKKPFSMPELYTDEFADWSFISGITFTPDEKDMYLYYSDDMEYLLHFKVR